MSSGNKRNSGIKTATRAKKKRIAPGPKPDVLKINGDWRKAVKKSLVNNKPPEGWLK